MRATVLACHQEKAPSQQAPGSLLPDNAATENLLKTLTAYNRAFESVDSAMQDIVGILGERDVSWTTI